MKNILILFLSFILIFIFFNFCNADGKTVEAYIFYSEGCPHCKSMNEFLNGLEYEYPQLEVYRYELISNQESRKLLEKMAKAYKTTTGYVPMVFVGDKVIVGDNEQAVKTEVEKCVNQGCVNPSERISGEIPQETTVIENGATPVNSITQIENNESSKITGQNQNTGYIILIITGLLVMSYIGYIVYKNKK